MPKNAIIDNKKLEFISLISINKKTLHQLRRQGLVELI